MATQTSKKRKKLVAPAPCFVLQVCPLRDPLSSAEVFSSLCRLLPLPLATETLMGKLLTAAVLAAGAYVTYRVATAKFMVVMRAKAMTGKVAVVTGGTSGVGKEACKRLISNGVKVPMSTLPTIFRNDNRLRAATDVEPHSQRVGLLSMRECCRC